MTKDKRSERRIEWFLAGGLILLLVWTPQVFWPTDPETVDAASLILGLSALVAFFKGLGLAPPMSRLPLIALRLCQGLLFGLMLLVMGWMHACGYLVAALVSIPLAIGLGTLHVLTFFSCLTLYGRRPSMRPRLLVALALMLFVGNLQFVAWAAWMWSPPSAEVCEEVAAAPEVTRLSPATWPQEPSHPYDLIYIPEEGWLFASFKMGGNGAMAWWDNHEANRVFGINTQKGAEKSVIPLPGRPLPQYMTYRAETRELVVSRMGPTQSSLDLVDLSAAPELKVTRSRSVDFSSHELVSHPTEPRFGVFGDHGEFFTMEEGSLELSSMTQIEKPDDHGAVTLNAWHRPGSSKVYVNFLLYPMAEIDMDTGQVRWTEVLFGGGQLAGRSDLNEVYQSDMLLNRVDVIETETMALSRRLELDYAPRPLVVDPQRDLLVVGGWLDGRVRFYRLSTLSKLDSSAELGPYLRDFAYDARRGVLYAGSKCGVFELALDTILGARAAD